MRPFIVSKLFFTICWCLLSHPTVGQNLSGDFSVILRYTTNTKISNSLSLVRQNHQILLNQVPLTAERVLAKKKLISFLANPDLLAIAPQLQCPAGNYFFQVSNTQQTRTEYGCLGTERFGQLFLAFTRI